MGGSKYTGEPKSFEEMATREANEPDHAEYTCECGWRGEGVELTGDGECPKCYKLLKEEE